MTAIGRPDGNGVRQVLSDGEPTGITISEDRGLFVVEDRRENHRGSLCRYPDMWAAMEAAVALVGQKLHVEPVRRDEPSSETEEAFQRRVIAYAKANGWMVAHFRPAKTEKGWRTPVEGHAGFVDLVLARDGVVHHWELKAEGKYPSAEQRAWGRAMGASYRLFRPSDWDEVVALLSGVPEGLGTR